MSKTPSTTKKKSTRGRPRNANPTTSSTWSIKGIENETRTKVAKAAKQAKQTIGNYVNRALIDAANETLGKPKEKTEVAMTTDQILENVLKSQAETNEQINKLIENQNKPFLKRLFSS